MLSTIFLLCPSQEHVSQVEISLIDVQIITFDKVHIVPHSTPATTRDDVRFQPNSETTRGFLKFW